MNAMILAAGLGTRLGSLGQRLPKVLIDVGGVPLLERHLAYLQRQNVGRVVINAHHHAERLQSFIYDYDGSLEVVCLIEQHLLGTAGAVRNALPLLEPGPFLVLYGDVYIDESLDAMIDVHCQHGAVATIAVYEAESAEGKGVVEVEATGRVRRFAEKQSQAGGPVLVNAGVYILESDIVAPLIPGVASDFGHDVFPKAVEEDSKVFAWRLSSPVIDIGTPEGLSLARELTHFSCENKDWRVMSPEISVVICAHDEGRWRELQASTHSLERQALQPREVVVVVDHNRRLFERARAVLQSAIVVENTMVRGLGGARNSGIVASSAPIVAFLDDDAVASQQWLALLAERYREPDVAGVGGGIEPTWEDARPGWFPPEFDWVVGCSYLGMPETVREVRNLFGCNMSFRREILDELGGFRLGYGCDETELCIRIRQRWPDKRLLYVPEAKVFHHVSRSRTGFQRFVSRCYFEGGSKAVVTRLVGIGHGLSSERRYIRAVLPAGLRRGFSDFFRRGDAYGLARAATILTGLVSTAAGYAAATFSIGKAARRRGWSGQF